MWDETAADIEVIWVGAEAEYFCDGGLDRKIGTAPVGQIS
jgi:hypothetical protein